MRIISLGVICALWRCGPLVAADGNAAGTADKQVERAIAAKILDDPFMRRSRNITVIARDGVVYLKGTVESLIDKMQAGLYAEQAEGVADVHNCLRVKFLWPWEDEACGKCGGAFEDDTW